MTTRDAAIACAGVAIGALFVHLIESANASRAELSIKLELANAKLEAELLRARSEAEARARVAEARADMASKLEAELMRSRADAEARALLRSRRRVEIYDDDNAELEELSEANRKPPSWNRVQLSSAGRRPASVVLASPPTDASASGVDGAPGSTALAAPEASVADEPLAGQLARAPTIGRTMPPALTSATSATYGCFLSHFKAEAAMEARFLQTELESLLGKPCFLDSDDLRDLRLLQVPEEDSNRAALSSALLLSTAHLHLHSPPPLVRRVSTRRTTCASRGCSCWCRRAECCRGRTASSSS